MLLSIMAVQPNLGFAATFIGSKIDTKLAVLYFQILFSVLIVGYLKF
jgi:hypothetical protein